MANICAAFGAQGGGAATRGAAQKVARYRYEATPPEIPRRSPVLRCVRPPTDHAHATAAADKEPKKEPKNEPKRWFEPGETDMNSSEVLFCALILIQSAEIAPNGRADLEKWCVRGAQCNGARGCVEAAERQAHRDRLLRPARARLFQRVFLCILGVRPPAEHWALEKLGDRLEKNLSHVWSRARSWSGTRCATWRGCRRSTTRSS